MVGLVIAALAAGAAHLWQRRRPPDARSRMPVIFTGVLAGLVYLFAIWRVGAALVDVGDDERVEDLARWADDPPALSRLVIAAATPSRRTAIEKLYSQLAPAALRGDILARRVALQELYGVPCEQIVEQLTMFSHHDEAIARAKRCPDSAALANHLAQAHLGLGQIEAAAIAIEHAIQLGELEIEVEEAAALLAMGRRWSALEQLATRLAGVTKTEEKPAVALPGPLGDLPTPPDPEPSFYRDTWMCIALAARYRGGDAAALAELRARTFSGGAGNCRILAADATRSLEDLQVLSEAPLTAADLARPVEPPPPRGDVAQQLIAYRDELVTPPKPPPTWLPSVDYPDAHVRGPMSWWDTAPSSGVALRRAVLAVHAPGAEVNYIGEIFDAEPSSLVWGVAGFERADRGAVVRIARAVLPFQGENAASARFAEEVFPAAAAVLARAGHHDEAAAYVELAVAQQRRVPVDPEWHLSFKIDALEELGATALGVLVRAGRIDEASALLAELAKTPHAFGGRLSNFELAVPHFVTIARGDVEACGDVFEYGWNGGVEAAVEAAFAGDAAPLARLDYADLAKLGRLCLPYLARRHPANDRAIRDFLRNYPRQEPGLLEWLPMHGQRLHIAEALGDEPWIAQLRAVNDAFLEAITADDTWLLVMLTHTLR